MAESDRDYYRRRMSEEAGRAEAAACDRIRGVHLDLLELYSERLAALDSGPPVASSERLGAGWTAKVVSFAGARSARASRR